jgi:hypothetical protein
LDTNALIRLAEQEAAEGNRSAKKTVELPRGRLVKERDSDGLGRLLEVADRLDNAGDLPYAIRQNLKFLSRQEQRGTPRRRVRELALVLILHAFGALNWLAFMAFAADAGSSRQAYAALAIGAGTWVAAALIVAWLWRSGRSRFALAVPFAWWFPSWILAFEIVYGLNERV